jgi:hypothetical protein
VAILRRIHRLEGALTEDVHPVDVAVGDDGGAMPSVTPA